MSFWEPTVLDVDDLAQIQDSFSPLRFRANLAAYVLVETLLVYGLFKWVWGLVFQLCGRFFGREEPEAVVREVMVGPTRGEHWYTRTAIRFRVGNQERLVRLTRSQAARIVAAQRTRPGDVGRLRHLHGHLLSWRRSGDAAQPVTTAFISYDRRDAPKAQLIASVLERHGVTPWLDESEINPLDHLTDTVVHGIQSAECFVPLLSSHYFSSEWCLRELDMAAASDPSIRIAPIQLDNRILMPEFVQTLLKDANDPVFADLSRPEGIRQVRSLAERLRAEAEARHGELAASALTDAA